MTNVKRLALVLKDLVAKLKHVYLIRLIYVIANLAEARVMVMAIVDMVVSATVETANPIHVQL
jgi:hypothetical protein